MSGATIKTEPLDPADNTNSQTASQSSLYLKIEKTVELPDQAENVMQASSEQDLAEYIPNCTHLMSCGEVEIKNELKKDPDTANLKAGSSITSGLQIKEERVIERKWTISGSNIQHFVGQIKTEDGVRSK